MTPDQLIKEFNSEYVEYTDSGVYVKFTGKSEKTDLDDFIRYVYEQGLKDGESTKDGSRRYLLGYEDGKKDIIQKAHIIDKNFDGNMEGIFGNIVLVFKPEYEEVIKLWCSKTHSAINKELGI